MKKSVLIIGVFLTGVALFQVMGYYLVGERRIHIACMKNLKTFAIDVDSVGIYSPYINLTDNEKTEIKKALKFEWIEFTSNPNEFSKKYRHNERGYGMGYKIQHLNWIAADIVEHNGMLYYGEVWKSRFVWILFRWFQIKQENVGQS